MSFQAGSGTLVGCLFQRVPTMKSLLSGVSAIVLLIASCGSAQACWLWPFGGYWGAGYNAAPAGYGYGGYGYGGYGSGFAVPSYSAGYPVWSVGYAGYSGSVPGSCCAVSCCDPCGGCASGACSSGSCVGVTGTTLKAEPDPGFQRGSKDYEKDQDTKEQDDIDDLLERRRRSRLQDDPDARENPMRDDEFQTPGTAGSRDESGSAGDAGGPPMFDTGNESGTDDGTQLRNRPEIQDPATDSTGNNGTSGDGKTFFDNQQDGTGAPDAAGSGAAPQARRHVPSVLASRSSSLAEVIAPRRLASRSVHSALGPASRQSSNVARQTRENQVDANRPVVRWIGVPEHAGVSRL